MTLPEPLVTYLSAGPVLGEPEQILPLLTVDPDGAPRACLLSRAQVRASGAELRAAVTSEGTKANLLARRQALLLVTLGDTVHHCALDPLASKEADGMLGTVFGVRSHKADSLHIALAPATFLATSEIADYERWEETAAFLAALAPA